MMAGESMQVRPEALGMALLDRGGRLGVQAPAGGDKQRPVRGVAHKRVRELHMGCLVDPEAASYGRGHRVGERIASAGVREHRLELAAVGPSAEYRGDQNDPPGRPRQVIEARNDDLLHGGRNLELGDVGRHAGRRVV